ncbi:MAG: hypothetical protein ABIO17_03075 [Pseudoxanthomonas sp.]
MCLALRSIGTERIAQPRDVAGLRLAFCLRHDEVVGAVRVLAVSGYAQLHGIQRLARLSDGFGPWSPPANTRLQRAIFRPTERVNGGLSRRT